MKNINKKITTFVCILIILAILSILVGFGLLSLYEEYQLVITIFIDVLSIVMLIISYNKKIKELFLEKINTDILFICFMGVVILFFGSIIAFSLGFIAKDNNMLKNLINITTLFLAFFPYGYMLFKECKEYKRNQINEKRK